MTTITPFNELIGSPSINGLWSIVSSPTPAPNPPAVYNGSMAFDSSVNPEGAYVLNYCVDYLCEGAQTHCTELTINYEHSTPATNNECSQALKIPLFSNGNGQLTGDISGTNKGACNNNYTLSTVAVPFQWTTSLDGDAWFLIIVSPSTLTPDNYLLTVEVDGTPYGASGIQIPYIGLYEDDCTTNLSQAQGANQYGALNYVFDGSIGFIYKIRVTSPQVNSGDFDITITIQK